MKGLLPGTAFSRLAVASGACGQFTLFDVGCSGGIDLAWRSLGDRLTAFGFDPNLRECERLTSVETLSGVEYVPSFVGVPGDSAFVRRRAGRGAQSRSPWERLSVARLVALREARLGAMSAEELRDLNLWGQTDLADPSRPVVLSEFARQRGIADVDFIKIDVDGEDFAILSETAPSFDDWRLLGVGIEVNFFGSDNDTDHTFHNMDRLMRRYGFDLFGLTINRYSHRAVPSVSTWRNPSETRNGRPLQGDAIYLRDICAPENAAFVRSLSPAKRLKLAITASLAGVPDFAGEVLNRFREELVSLLDLKQAFDLLVAQMQAQDGGQTQLSYAEYMAAFEADDAMFYTLSD